MTAANIRYALADRVQGPSAGGIGAMHVLARKSGLIGSINSLVHVLERHFLTRIWGSPIEAGRLLLLQANPMHATDCRW